MSRREYQMSEEQLATLMAASKPVVCIKVGSYVPRSLQQNANDAWEALGREMGFDSSAVKPVPGKGTRFFTADSLTEVETQSGRDG